MKLPIDEVLPELLAALRAGANAVLQAPPGAGKTTRVPLALLDQPWLAGRRLIMLEPRRLAARAAARFMAAQLDEEPGGRVGYRTRLDSRIGRRTRIEVVTEGTLTRLLQDDPELAAYGAVIFDEFHERSLQADLGLALTLEAQQALRPDLRLLVMSATLDAEPVAQLLGGAPLISSHGRAYPVERRYLPPGRTPLEQHTAGCVRRALEQESGSVLVFLPGGREIRRVARLLGPSLPADVTLTPLYGDLAQTAQDAAIAPAPPGRRKVVLATAIAETSLTIEGIRIVVDAGLSRRSRFDPGSGLSRLATTRVSLAAAEQRAGRAGRLQPGVCYRLWSESEHSRLAAFSPPEIREADLSPLVLELAQWGARAPERLQWLDLPPAPAWAQARELLQRLGALDAEGRISEHGRSLLALGLPPRLGHMVREGERRGWLHLSSALAALLAERDIGANSGSDITDRLPLLESPVGRHVRTAAQRIRSHLQGPQRDEPTHAAGLLLAFAYPDRIALRRSGTAPRFLLANGRGGWLPEHDSLGEEPLIVAAALDGERREARIFLAAALERAAFETEFGPRTEETVTVGWDAAADAVSARRQRRYKALVLADAPIEQPDPAMLTHALLGGIRRRGLECLPWTPALRQWQARVALLRRLQGEHWPDVDDAALLADLEQWAAPFLSGFSRLAHLRSFPMQEALYALLDYGQQRELERLAPARLEVPSGSRVALDYTAGPVPILPVRLQEMFGLADTPTIADGRIRLLLHLLSPAGRPVQVTQDLAGFWRNSYFDVRKDLRGRYPKHAWPEEPWNAVPRQRRRG
jgi:ATP-dependent helicase HrpB